MCVCEIFRSLIFEIWNSEHRIKSVANDEAIWVEIHYSNIE